jgi:predicted Fe-S protein YdhL (DUF1289 family)
MPSPCERVCKVENGVCLTCNRTLDEIALWGSLSEQEQVERMEELEERVV